jgi:hypothetical protein
MQLRLDGNELAQSGEMAVALAKYEQGGALAPEHMRHKLHSNIALLHLSLGDAEASRMAAEAAVASAPPDWSTVGTSVATSMLHCRCCCAHPAAATCPPADITVRPRHSCSSALLVYARLQCLCHAVRTIL